MIIMRLNVFPLTVYFVTSNLIKRFLLHCRGDLVLMTVMRLNVSLLTVHNDT
jgi:hypothetical protein